MEGRGALTGGERLGRVIRVCVCVCVCWGGWGGQTGGGGGGGGVGRKCVRGMGGGSKVGGWECEREVQAHTVMTVWLLICKPQTSPRRLYLIASLSPSCLHLIAISAPPPPSPSPSLSLCVFLPLPSLSLPPAPPALPPPPTPSWHCMVLMLCLKAIAPPPPHQQPTTTTLLLPHISLALSWLHAAGGGAVVVARGRLGLHPSSHPCN